MCRGVVGQTARLREGQERHLPPPYRAAATLQPTADALALPVGRGPSLDHRAAGARNAHRVQAVINSAADGQRGPATRKTATPNPIMRRALLAAAVILVLAAAWVAPQAIPGVRAQASPRLASLHIAIWPEFDREAMALVILSGELADEVPLPATVAIHIPASSGAPAAVAYADSDTATLLSLDYDLAAAEASLLVTFTTPGPHFQVEFYDPLSIDTSNRSYTYLWPGDLAVDDLAVEVQQPTGATDLSTEPDLGDSTVGPDQLEYRSAQMGSLEAGKPLAVNLTYTKTDLRTSSEILGIAGAGSPAPPQVESDDGVPPIAIVAAVIATLVVVAGAGVYWRWRTRLALAPVGPAPGRRRGRRGPSGSAEKPEADTFCTQCGDPLLPGRRFCPECGAPAKAE